MTNTNGGDFPSGTPSERLDRVEAILESFASGLVETRALVQSNAKSLESFTSGLAETRALVQSNAKSIEALSSDATRARRRTDAQIAQVTRDVAALTAHQATMFEIIQGLNEDRVSLAENMASIAQSLAKLAEGQSQ